MFLKIVVPHLIMSYIWKASALRYMFRNIGLTFKLRELARKFRYITAIV